MKSKNIFILAMLGISQMANAYDITDAIDAALKNNTQLKGSEITLQSAKVDRFAAATGFLPTIGFQSNSSSIASLGTTLQNGTPSSNQLTIQQAIFSGGKGVYDLKATKYGLDAAVIQYQNNIDQIVLQAVQAYENVLATREAYTVSEQKVYSLQKIAKQTEVKLAVGTITKTNMLEAKAALAAATSEKATAYSNMKNSEETFRYVTGDTAPAMMHELDITNLVLPSNLDLFLEQVEENNQKIIIADKTLTAKQFATRSAKTTLLPTVSGSISIAEQKSWQQSMFAPPSLQKVNGETYQLSINVPIFQSGVEYVNIKKAQLNEDAAEITKDDTIIQVHMDAAKAWNQYNQTKASVQSDKDSVEYYSEFARGADEEFQIGTKTLTDLLQAQVQYESSRIQLIQDKANMIISALNMRFIMGDLRKVNFSKLVSKEANQKSQNNPNIVKQDADLSGKKIVKVSETSS
jgi:outer membrane protein